MRPKIRYDRKSKKILETKPAQSLVQDIGTIEQLFPSPKAALDVVQSIYSDMMD